MVDGIKLEILMHMQYGGKIHIQYHIFQMEAPGMLIVTIQYMIMVIPFQVIRLDEQDIISLIGK